MHLLLVCVSFGDSEYCNSIGLFLRILQYVHVSNKFASWNMAIFKEFLELEAYALTYKNPSLDNKAKNLYLWMLALLIGV